MRAVSSSAGRISRANLFASLPPEWPAELRPSIQRAIAESGRKLVVLDDDPTGTQTVHGVYVLTDWSQDLLQAEMVSDRPAFFVLTNSRALPASAAEALNAEIGKSLAAAALACGRSLALVSRSDSTLRGHFPGELRALAAAVGTFDGWLLVPAFFEGGRYTVGDVHYVAEGSTLVPAGETPFARDSAFGYQASNLRQWVEEKTAGLVRADEVLSISLDDLRRGGPQQVARRLWSLEGGRCCVANAVDYRDLEVLVLGLLAAEARGKRFLYRTASSFVQVRAGLSSRPLLAPHELALPASAGGLTVVGSYVPRTTQQLSALLQMPAIVGVEISVPELLERTRFQETLASAAQQADQALRAGRDVVVYTSRELVTVADAAASLSIGERVSSGLIAVLQQISTRPRYLIAKGGITSSDVATQALGVRKALVRGQILPGVPIWQLGAESRYPGMPYVVFPGNVGEPDSLARLVHNLRAAQVELPDQAMEKQRS